MPICGIYRKVFRGGIGLLYEVSILIVGKSEKVVHSEVTMDDTFMFSVHHSVCGDKCDYQCFSGLCRHTEQSQPFQNVSRALTKLDLCVSIQGISSMNMTFSGLKATSPDNLQAH